MSEDAAYFPSLGFRIQVSPYPISSPGGDCEMTENTLPTLGTFDVESLKPLNGVDAEVLDWVKPNLL